MRCNSRVRPQNAEFKAESVTFWRSPAKTPYGLRMTLRLMVLDMKPVDGVHEHVNTGEDWV